MDDENNIKLRKVYDINELLQTGDKKLMNLYYGISNASKYAYDNCDIKNPLNYDVFNEIEKNAIKLEKDIAEEKYKDYENIIKSIKQTESIPNLQYIKDNYEAIKKNNELDIILGKINNSQ